MLKLRMFPLSLADITFTWFASLSPNSICTWAQLGQKKFMNSFNLNIFDKDLVDLVYSGLLLHLKQKLESHVFSNVSQVLQQALNCESQAKEYRNFPRTSDKPRNERHVNMVEYSSESPDDEEPDMCVAEWNWGSKSNPML
jgi:hypothetical protein